ncbi:MAG: oligosaccharide flippase family protein [Alicyclobacillus sp.]|nr:oligosaccharide flippase family protein [Alicyclobacillus sp.]
MRQGGFRYATVQTLVSYAATLVANFVGGAVVSRALGPLYKGEYVSIAMWYNVLLWVFNLSFSQVTVYFVGKDKRQATQAASSIALASILCGVMAFIVAALCIMPRLEAYVSYGSLIFLFSSLPLSTVFQVASGGLNARHQFGFTNTIMVLRPVLLFLVYLAMYLGGRISLENVVLVLAGATWLFNAILVVYAFCRRVLSFNIKWDLLREAVIYGVKAHGATLSDVANGNITSMVLSLSLSPRYLGYYSTAQSVSSVVNVIPQAMGTTLFPRLSAAADEEVHETFLHAWRGVMLLTLFFGGVLALCCPWVIPLVFGSRFDQAIVPAVLLILASFLGGQANVLRIVLNSRGFALVSSTSEISALTATLACALLLTPRFGAVGAAASTVVGAGVRIVVLATSYWNKICPLEMQNLLPSRDDVREAIDSALRLLSRNDIERQLPHQSEGRR